MNNEIKITISGFGGDTIASYLAIILYNEGFDVVVDDSDSIRGEFATKERLQTILQKKTLISVNME